MFTHTLNIYRYILTWNVLGIIQKWCNRKTCCNGNGTDNCFFKWRYNLKAKFCRLFFRRAYGEFGHINVFPCKWQKIRDKILNSASWQLLSSIESKILLTEVISLYFGDLCIGLWIGCNKGLCIVKYKTDLCFCNIIGFKLGNLYITS